MCRMIHKYYHLINQSMSGDSQTLEPENVLVLLDKFLQIYNVKHNTTGSMFENINIKDPLSTNDKMEMFYEYMKNHQDLFAENPEYINIYEPGEAIDNGNSYEVYALVTAENGTTIKYISLSFLSLLTYGCQSPKDIGSSSWNIIKL